MEDTAMVNWTAADERFATHALTVGRVDREAWKTEFSSLANEPLPPGKVRSRPASTVFGS
jgi:hypothetical protein